MRLIDADDLITAFSPGESVRTESVRATIEHMPTIHPGLRESQHEIGQSECTNAMLKMWLDNVVTDGEYFRIMEKLNAYWAERREKEWLNKSFGE